jgi:hypothetical protein
LGEVHALAAAILTGRLRLNGGDGVEALQGLRV